MHRLPPRSRAKSRNSTGINRVSPILKPNWPDCGRKIRTISHVSPKRCNNVTRRIQRLRATVEELEVPQRGGEERTRTPRSRRTPDHGCQRTEERRGSSQTTRGISSRATTWCAGQSGSCRRLERTAAQPPDGGTGNIGRLKDDLKANPWQHRTGGWNVYSIAWHVYLRQIAEWKDQDVEQMASELNTRSWTASATITGSPAPAINIS